MNSNPVLTLYSVTYTHARMRAHVEIETIISAYENLVKLKLLNQWGEGLTEPGQILARKDHVLKHGNK